MSSLGKRLEVISKADVEGTFIVPPAYIKGKSLFNINSANRMHFHQKSEIKNKYKKIIEPILNVLNVFKTGHVHLLVQVYWSDMRKRDLDNLVTSIKYIQDTLVDLGKLEDDKHISFTMLPAIHDKLLSEHKIEVTVMNIHSCNYFEKLKENK